MTFKFHSQPLFISRKLEQFNPVKKQQLFLPVRQNLFYFLAVLKKSVLPMGPRVGISQSAWETDDTLMCLSIGTPKNNKFSICSKWKIHYFQVSQNLGRVQPHYNVLDYWNP